MTTLFLQSGNYAEAWHRFRKGGPETYRDQKRSVCRVEALSACEPVTVVSTGDEPHDEQLTEHLRSIRISRTDCFKRRNMTALVKAIAPTKAISCAPNRVWHQALATWGVPTLPLYADRLTTASFVDKLRVRGLSRALNANNCQIVANHSLQASRSLRSTGYPDGNIIPWEFQKISAQGMPKVGPNRPDHFKLFFAGAIQASKGIGDCIAACRLLADRGIDFEFHIAGKGNIDTFQTMAEQMQIASQIRFLGQVPLEQIGELMRSSDVVVVPSRHEYAEGLPNVIYEALASRTPLVCSDHPAFAPRLPHQKAAMHFTAGDSASLADTLEEVLSTPALYLKLSEHSATALANLYIGIERLELIDLFINDPTLSSGWHRRIPTLESVCLSGTDGTLH